MKNLELEFSIKQKREIRKHCYLQYDIQLLNYEYMITKDSRDSAEITEPKLC